MNLSFIKLDINIMNDTKIKIIRKIPDGDKIIVLWVGILCLGMKSGKPGILEVGDGIYFDDVMLSHELDIPINTVKLGIETFKKLKMIEVFKSGAMYISNFEKHQELTKINIAKEKHRIAQFEYRERQMILSCDNHVIKSDVTDKEQEQKIDQEKEDIIIKSFEIFWDLYDYKKGKDNAYKKWRKLKKEEHDSIIAYLPAYIKSTPDKKFRKHPATFLNNRAWEDEITTSNKQGFQDKIETIPKEDFHNGEF